MSTTRDTGGGVDPIRIHAPRIEQRDPWVRVAFHVEGLDPSELWFDVDAAHQEFVAHSCDAAVAALLPAAMAAGKPILALGPLSPRLHWNLGNTVIPVVCRLLPFLQPVRVIAEGGTEEAGATGSAILTALSCGVDSLSAVQDHFLREDIPEGDRVTHLLFSHVGHHGYGRDVHVRAEERWERVQRAAEELGLPVLRVGSNTPEFYPPEYDSRLNWLATLTPRNSAVPLLLQSGVRRFLFASSHGWSDVRVGPTHDMSITDPILLPALSTERTELCSVGSERTRVEKTRAISTMPLARRFLDVCIMEGGDVNCSKCEKCLRTILTLELLGELAAFQGRFDLSEYRLHRTEFIARILTERRDAFHLEIQDLIRQSGASLPSSARIVAALLRMWRVMPHGLRRRLRGLPSSSDPS